MVQQPGFSLPALGTRTLFEDAGQQGADGGGDREEHRERHEVGGLLHRERVQRRREEEVQREEGAHRREEARHEPARRRRQPPPPGRTQGRGRGGDLDRQERPECDDPRGDEAGERPLARAAATGGDPSRASSSVPRQEPSNGNLGISETLTEPLWRAAGSLPRRYAASATLTVMELSPSSRRAGTAAAISSSGCWWVAVSASSSVPRSAPGRSTGSGSEASREVRLADRLLERMEIDADRNGHGGSRLDPTTSAAGSTWQPRR